MNLFEAEVGRQHLATSLAYMAALSIEFTQLEGQGLDPTSLKYQCHYLLQAISDDFPIRIEGLPKTTAGHLLLPGASSCQFMNQHGFAYLSHMLLLHAQGEQVSVFPNESAQRRFFRLLLIGNDYLGRQAAPSTGVARASLDHRRSISSGIVRLSQFSRSHAYYPTLEDFARQYLLYTEYLPKHYLGILERVEAASGLSVRDYFAAFMAIVSYFQVRASPDRPVGTLSGLLAEVESGKEVLESLLDSWTHTPTEYRDAHAEWVAERPPGDASLDLVLLREKPLIALADGALVCPHLPFLYEKVLDEPYFIFERSSEAGSFRNAFGAAYEDYVDDLIARIAKSDKGGAWQVVGKVKSSKRPGNEWEVDGYIQRRAVAIAFEHKAIRPSTKFLRGTDDGSVLGPAPREDTLLDAAGQNQEGRADAPAKSGRDDDGLLTRGLWRFSHAQTELAHRASLASGLPPATEVVPVLTRLSGLIVPEEVAAGYLGKLIDEAGLMSDPIWCMPPQWIDVRSLEFLARIAEAGQLDLEEFLRAKAATAPYGRFDEAVSNLANQLSLSPRDPRLADVWNDLLEYAQSRYFPESEVRDRLAKMQVEDDPGQNE